MNSGFQALVLEQRDGKTQASIRRLNTTALPDGDVLVAVDYSSINTKDAMAVTGTGTGTGTGKIVRHFPMVPGVDLAGTVLESASPLYQPGDKVVLTGWGVRERHWGGYSQRVRVKVMSGNTHGRVVVVDVNR